MTAVSKNKPSDATAAGYEVQPTSSEPQSHAALARLGLEVNDYTLSTFRVTRIVDAMQYTIATYSGRNASLLWTWQVVHGL